MKKIIITLFIMSTLLSCGRDNRPFNEEKESNFSQEDLPLSNDSTEGHVDSFNSYSDNVSGLENEKWADTISPNEDTQPKDGNQSISTPSSGIEERLNTIEEKLKDIPKKTSFFGIVLWIILAVFPVVIVFFLLSSRIINVNRRVKKVEDKLNSLLVAQQLNSQNVNVRPQVEERLKKLQKRIDDLESIHSAKESKTIDEKPSHVVEWKVNDEPKPKMDEQVVFYMATPDKDGFFNTTSQHNSPKQGTTFYRFTLDSKDKNKATFSFDSDEYGTKVCANYPQTYLDPVCEPINAENPNATRINTIDKGFAVKQGDKWIVTKKAKIRYE